MHVCYICVHVCYICVRVCMCIYTLICEKSKCWSLGRVQLFATLWTGARQASLSLDSPGKNTSPGDLSDPGIEPGSSTLQADFFLSSEPAAKPMYIHTYVFFSSLFRHWSSHSSEHSSLCCAGPCCLSVTCNSVTLLNSPLTPSCSFPFGKHAFVFCVCESISVL